MELSEEERALRDETLQAIERGIAENKARTTIQLNAMKTRFATYEQTIKALDRRIASMRALDSSVGEEENEACRQMEGHVVAHRGDPAPELLTFTPEQKEVIQQKNEQISLLLSYVDGSQKHIEYFHSVLAKPPPTSAELWASIGAKDREDFLRQNIERYPKHAEHYKEELRVYLCEKEGRDPHEAENEEARRENQEYERKLAEEEQRRRDNEPLNRLRAWLARGLNWLAGG